MSWCAMTVTALNILGSNPPAARPPGTTADIPRRPVATYSIVARDPQTGEMGVAVQSHWFSVGSVVSWAEAGVGAVATQSLVDPAYGPLGLELMRTGRTAPDALRSLLAGDDGRDVRQVAMIDAKGRVETHTGPRCIADAGHVVDADNQFSVQANLMANDKVWPAMAKAYRESTGDLADRLVAALEAAQEVGGDIRGKQSAALLVVLKAKHDEKQNGGVTGEGGDAAAAGEPVIGSPKVIRTVEQMETYIKELEATVENDRIANYRVNAKISFRLEDA